MRESINKEGLKRSNQKKKQKQKKQRKTEQLPKTLIIQKENDLI